MKETPYWWEHAPPTTVETPTVPTRADVAVIGSGYTGLSAALTLARALVFEPSLVLMDEPLGALDKKLREQMQIEIKLLHERLGPTVVYVTHVGNSPCATSSVRPRTASVWPS